MLQAQNSNAGFYRCDLDRDGRATTVIYSTLDKLHVGQSYSGSEYFTRLDHASDLEINATDLELVGDFVVPCGELRIVCRRLTIPAPDKPGAFAVTLDVSGPTALETPYDHPLATVGQSGRDGDAVATAVNADSTSALVPDSLTLTGTSHFADKGAKGGRILILADEIDFQGRLRLVANGGVGFPGCNGENAIGQGVPGRAGHGGEGGDGGRIEIGVRLTHGMTLGNAVETEMQPGRQGQDGKPGYNEDSKTSGRHATAAGSGLNGTLIEAHAHDIRARIGEAASDAFLYRLYQQVRRDYLFADDDVWSDIGESLTFIADITQGYGKNEATRPIAYRIYRKINGLYNFWTNDRNAFGWSQEWVPSTPWETMRDSFDNGQKFWQILFDRVQAATKEDATKEQAQKALSDARMSAYGQVKNHQAKSDMYAAELDKLLVRTSQGHSNFLAAKAALSTALAGFAKTVTDHFDCPSLDKILSAAESIVFTMSNPGEAAAMAGVQVAKLINDGATKIGSLDKSQLVDEVVDLRNQTVGLTDSVRTVGFERDGHGNLVPKPGQRLMLAKMDDLESEISGVAKELGKDATEPVMTAIEAMRSTIIELGEARYLYNTYALRAFEEGESAIEAKATLDKLDQTPDPQTEDWHEAVSFLCGLYQASVESIAEDVALLQRKFAYVALQADVPIQIRSDLDGLWETNAPDPSDLNEWSTKVQVLYRKMTSVQSDKDAALSPFPTAAGVRSDLHISITDPAILKPLIDTGELVIMPTWYQGTNPADPRTSSYPQAYVANVRLFSEIRLTKIQPRIYGATTPKKRIEIGIVVSPRTVLLSGAGTRLQPYLFDNHNHRSSNIVQLLRFGPNNPTDDDIGTSIDGNLKDDYLDAVGLYAEYVKITLTGSDYESDDNFGLNRSGITEVRLYFKGLARST